jgi:hypothetical protein
MDGDETPVAVVRDAHANRPKFNIDWTINPSHIIAFIGLIVGSFAFIYGLRDDLNRTNSHLEQLVLELKNKNDLQDNEIKGIKDTNISAKTEEIQFRGEMRNSITDITKLLTDIQIDNAARSGIPSARSTRR